jgi:N-ethylmaleimide reductase
MKPSLLSVRLRRLLSHIEPIGSNGHALSPALGAPICPSSRFSPVRMGDLDLRNRIVMAPLTRMRAGPIDHVPTALQVEYYAQRASAGLIVAEATAISPDGFGWADTPGLWSAEQVRGWRRVTNAVHAAGGRIIAQLWHTGAIAHPDLRGGTQPLSASDVNLLQESVTPTGRKPTVSAPGDRQGVCGESPLR